MRIRGIIYIDPYAYVISHMHMGRYIHMGQNSDKNSEKCALQVFGVSLGLVLAIA